MSGALLFWLALLAVLGLWMLGAHNRVTAMKAALLAAWQPVDAALQARGQLLAALLPGLPDDLDSEAAALAAAQAQVQAAADAVRRSPLDRDAVAALSQADALLAAALAPLLARVDQHPALPADTALAAALQALAELPPRLAYAREQFNAAGQTYNAATAQFPTRLLASALRFGQAGRL